MCVCLLHTHDSTCVVIKWQFSRVLFFDHRIQGWSSGQVIGLAEQVLFLRAMLLTSRSPWLPHVQHQGMDVQFVSSVPHPLSSPLPVSAVRGVADGSSSWVLLSACFLPWFGRVGECKRKWYQGVRTPYLDKETRLITAHLEADWYGLVVGNSVPGAMAFLYRYPLGAPQCLADVLTCLEWHLGTQRAGLCPGSRLLPGTLTKGWALAGVGDSLFLQGACESQLLLTRDKAKHGLVLCCQCT